MRGKKALFVASWIILLIMAMMTAFGGLASTYVAYSRAEDRIGQLTFDQMRSMGDEDAIKMIRGRRVTAATWALAYAILFGWVVLFPYRRGERWAWWALLFSLGLSQLLSLARAPLLGTTIGAGASATALAFLLLGLLAGSPYMFARHSTISDSALN
jgi:hypothetical protein